MWKAISETWKVNSVECATLVRALRHDNLAFKCEKVKAERAWYITMPAWKADLLRKYGI